MVLELQKPRSLWQIMFSIHHTDGDGGRYYYPVAAKNPHGSHSGY